MVLTGNNQNQSIYTGLIKELIKATRGEVEEVPIRKEFEMALSETERHVGETDFDYAHRLFLIGLDIYNQKYANALDELRGSSTLVGYEEQLDYMTVDLMEWDTPNVVLLGEAGVGKTETVSKWVYNNQSAGKNQFMVVLSIELMGALALPLMVSRFKTLLRDLAFMRDKISERVPFKLAIFIDELHKLTLYPADSEAVPLIEAMKEDLARGTLPFVGATTSNEFNKRLASIEAIERRFEKVVMQKPKPDDVLKIMSRSANERYEKPKEHRPIKVSQEMIRKIMMFSSAHMPELVEPARSLKMMRRAIAHAEFRNADEVEFVDVEHAFKQDSVELRATVRPEHVEEIVRNRIKGQPLAIEAVIRAIRNSFWFPKKPKDPFMTLLFDGTTGVGKTELAKALAEAYYGSEDYVVTVNGGDYSRPEDVEELKNFIGNKFAVNKRQLLLLDEIEKMHRNVVLSLMRLIDEGKTYDENGVERSLKSAIIIGTSNLGATLFDNLKLSLNLESYENPSVLTPELKNAFERIEMELRERLIQGDEGRDNGFKPEFLERFTEIVPFMPLTKATLLEIVRMKLDNYIAGMELQLNVKVSLPPKIDWRKRERNKYNYVADPVSLYFVLDVMGEKSSSAGVRRIDNWIREDIGGEISRQLTINPNIKAFNIKTNGKASFESNDGLDSGRIVIEEVKTSYSYEPEKISGGIKW